MEQEINQDRSRALYDRYAPFYNLLHHVQTLWADSTHRKEVVRIANLNGNIKVIDIGCGTGLTSIELLKENKNIFIISIDYSLKMLKQIKNSSKKQINLNVICCNAEFLPIKSGSIDAALSAYGLGGIPNLGSVINEIHRVIRSKGIICFGEMISPPETINSSFIIFHRYITRPIIRFFWEFRDINLELLISMGGFSILKKKYFKDRIFGSTLIVKAYKS
jgi:ubiquinone/menaquinone biosynthesis C-methylase UbiE